MVFTTWFKSSAAVAATVAAQTATKLERMRNAEQRLLEFAKSYAAASTSSSHGDSPSSSWLQMEPFDTHIPRSAVPLKGRGIASDDSSLVIHGVHVQSKPISTSTTMSTSTSSETTETPLVLLHGYMNAGAYFYRNFGGLARYFRNIYAIDMLGWGLSSRPSMDELLMDDHTDNDTLHKSNKSWYGKNNRKTTTKEERAVDIAEDWFVESLEAWREAHKIDKMILAGHSFGGYMSVAYTERYPERVERLILLSPVGVPDPDTDPAVDERRQRYQSTWRGRVFLGVFQGIFENTTIGSILRKYMSEERSYGMAHNYVTRRLPEISDPNEAKTVADYLYWNSMLPGSGEFFVHNILTGLVMARRPLQYRIPNLKVPEVSILYGSTDWMDISGGLNTQQTCEAINDEIKSSSSSMSPAPAVNVYMVPDAGHLLMLQNWQGTNDGIIYAAGGSIEETESSPKQLHPSPHRKRSDGKGTSTEKMKDVKSLWLEKTLQSRQQMMVDPTAS